MAVEYTLRIREPHTHLVEVEVRLRPADTPLELVMPSWTPGSYLLREFARHVQDFRAHDAGGPLAFRKTDKNTWRIEGHATGTVTASYVVYANELSVRTSHVDASHAYLNGASIFMYPKGMEGEPAILRIEAPEGWRVATSLHEADDGTFHASDYDELVDCPLEIGLHRVIAWEVDGIPHRYAIWGPGEIDEARLVSDTTRIIETCAAMFGGLPYDRYLFLVHVVPNGRGGLEHRTSCSLHVSPSWLAGPDYERLLALVAHEFFHVWPGKRIRPEPLGPFDYTRENYTRNLWVVEGFTTYYTDRILLRAGLMTRERYLARLGDSIARLEALPGRRHQSLEESSFDTWIKFYRPNAHTPNSQVSYYHKGSLVALALDLEIRRATDGARSLDDVMRLLWERYGRHERGFPEERERGIQAVVEEVLGAPVDGLMQAYVAGTEEIDFDRHLEAVGLGLEEGEGGNGGVDGGREGETADGGSASADTLVAASGSPAGDDARPASAAEAEASSGEGGRSRRVHRATAPPIEAPGPCERRLGMRLRLVEAQLRVGVVLEGTPAWEAGVNAGDAIVAVDGAHIGVHEMESLAGRLETGTELELTLLRREQLVTVRVRMAAAAPRRARIVSVPASADQQSHIREAWLSVGRLVDGSAPHG